MINNRKDYWSFCLNRLDVLRSTAKPVWTWTGDERHQPIGRIREWLDMFIKSDYRPTIDEIVQYSPDAGSAQERFDTAVHIAYTTAFAMKFGIGMQGVLFSLTYNDIVTVKTEISEQQNN
jgi:hypothetical protein